MQVSNYNIGTVYKLTMQLYTGEINPASLEAAFPHATDTDARLLLTKVNTSHNCDVKLSSG